MTFRRFAVFGVSLALLVGGIAFGQQKKNGNLPVITPKMSDQGPARSDTNLPKITPQPAVPRPSKEGIDFFEAKIRPVLVRHCYKCHSGDVSKAKGHFVLDTHDGLFKGGNSGEVVVPRHPEKSLLIEALKYEGLEMPPTEPLSEEVIEDFEKWVEMGAPDPRIGKAANPKVKIDLAEAKRFWAFQRPRISSPPTVHDTKWPSTEIDRFILARLEKEQLTPVQDADPVTLVRRLTFDLTGLPPTPEEIDDYVNDKSNNPYSKLVDRLLESPRFGEKWGRHWLDVVRYAESTGKERNIPYRYAWRYRNYVIDAFNSDKPYDKFVVEQLAGDMLPTKTMDEHNQLVVATGFLAIGPKAAVNGNVDQFQMDVIDDQIDVTGRAFLGMTIACARCHDHKFDPIPQTDYYAIAGIFHSTETLAGIQPGRRTAMETKLIKLVGEDKHPKGSQELSKEQKEQEEEIAKIERQLDDLQAKMKAATRKPPPNRAKNVKRKVPAVANVPKVDLKSLREQIKKQEDRLEELEAKIPPSANLAMGVRDAASPANINLRVRGELTEKGPVVPRGVLTVLQTGDTTRLNPKNSGRFALAHWIVDKNNPLTARVMVNRIWEHLFGQGLVDTVDNFGGLGNEPSHPELLDTLAVQFMEHKWSIKNQIRSFVLSRTYRLSSNHDDANYEKDSADKFLWRMPRRRLDAEEIRDAMLMASGQIDLSRPESSPTMELSSQGVAMGGGLQQIRKPSNVRSIYLPILRGQTPEMLAAFDVADPELIVGKRDTTTVPTQALFLMNNPFVLKQAEEFAKRVLKTPGLDQAKRIDLAYQIAVGRLPTETERKAVATYINDFRKSYESANPKGNPNLAAWSSCCQALFESGLFRYAY